jgi:protocadherin Fat 4
VSDRIFGKKNMKIYFENYTDDDLLSQQISSTDHILKVLSQNNNVNNIHATVKNERYDLLYSNLHYGSYHFGNTVNLISFNFTNILNGLNFGFSRQASPDNGFNALSLASDMDFENFISIISDISVDYNIAPLELDAGLSAYKINLIKAVIEDISLNLNSDAELPSLSRELNSTENKEDIPMMSSKMIANGEIDVATPNSYAEKFEKINVYLTNEAPKMLTLQNVRKIITENADTSKAILVADIWYKDDGIGTNTFVLEGRDADYFEIIGNQLFLKAGVSLDYEKLSDLQFSLKIYDTALGMRSYAKTDNSIVILDINEQPFKLDLTSATVFENNLAGTIIGELRAQDEDAEESFIYTLVDENGNSIAHEAFEIIGNKLVVKTNPNLDFETKPTHELHIKVTDSGGLSKTETFEISVTDVNEAATSVTLSNVINTIDENTDTSSSIKVADISVTDDALGTNVLSLTGADAAKFEIVDNGGQFELHLRAGETLDFESDAGFDVTVNVDDAGVGGSPDASTNYSLSIADRNEEASAVQLNNLVTDIDENTDTSARIKIADIAVSDDALGTNVLSLSGADANLFEIDGNELFLKAGTVLNFEGDPSFDVSVDVADTTADGYDGNAAASASTTLNVTDVNEAATAVTLSNIVTNLDENSDTSASTKVADIAITDDALGTNTLSLSGADAAKFEIVDNGGQFELHLRAGETLDFESDAGFDVTVNVDDAGVGASPDASTNYSLSVTDRNEEATAVQLNNLVTDINENTDTTNRIKIADIAVSDDALGTNVLSLSGADANLFEIDGNELFLKAGTVLNFEGDPSFDVTVEVADNTADGYDGNAAASVSTTLSVTDVNEAATAVTLSNVVNTIDENTDTTNSIKVADISVTDDALGTNVLSLSGADSAKFEIVDNGGQFELHLRAGETLDFESDAGFDVTVNVDDAGVGGTPDASTNYSLSVADRNEEATSVQLNNLVTDINENTDTSARIKIADIAVSDDALGTNVLSLSGADANLFEIDGNELFLKAGTVLNFEGDPSFDVTVEVADNTADGYDGNAAASVSTTLSVTDVNEAATSVTLSNVVNSLDENTDTSSSIKVADISVTDDALGTNVLSLSGADSAKFEIVDNGGQFELHLRAGETLDFESDAGFDVTVNVDDAGVGGSPDASTNYSLSIADRNEEATSVQLNNLVTDINENTDTTNRIKIADIAVSDDALGTTSSHSQVPTPICLRLMAMSCSSRQAPSLTLRAIRALMSPSRSQIIPPMAMMAMQRPAFPQRST